MADTPQAEETAVIAVMRNRLQAVEAVLQKQPHVSLGNLVMLSGMLRSQLEKIYGKDSPLLMDLPSRAIDRSIPDPRAELIKRLELVRRFIEALEAVPKATKSPLLGKKIFIGHGASLVWLQLKVFLNDHLHLPCDEFNLEPVAGITTAARIETMLAQAGFAFVVMTAEEKHADGLVYARPNVIHESGLFQGKLGNPRAIILVEDGCSVFSNIEGLTQIRFPHNNLESAFQKIRGVLKREGFYKGT